MKKETLLSVKCRFSDIESNVPLAIACLLNPRFKDRFLSGTIQQAEAKRMLLEELEKIDMMIQDHSSHHQNVLMQTLQNCSKVLMRY